jgi:hypothetical protein
VEGNGDTWADPVYEATPAIIPMVNLLANDVNNVGEQTELNIVSVDNAVNGTVSISGNDIIFTGTTAGPAQFEYTVQNGSDPLTATTVTVTLTVIPLPSVLAVNDSTSVQQAESIVLSTASLLANDIGSGLSVASVQDPVAGTVSLVGSTITFTSTDIAGVPAQFDYTVTDGTTPSTGTVFVTVTPLNPVSAFVFHDQALFDAKRTTYQPPTLKTVFDTWARFAGNTYWADGTTATGDAQSWILIADEDNDGNIDGDLDGDGTDDNQTSFVNAGRTFNGDIDGDGTFDARFMQLNNTGSFNGFLSPQTYDEYTHEATLWSEDTDNDLNGIAIAYDTGGGSGVLYVGRTQSGFTPSQGWGLVDGNTLLVNFNVDPLVNQWGGRATRVRIVRQGDIIQCWTAAWETNKANFFSPPPFHPDSLITIDLSQTTNNITYGPSALTASRDLTRYRGPKQFGYVNWSQRHSSFIDVDFDGGVETDLLILLQDQDPTENIWYDSEVWRFDTPTLSWVMTAETIQDALGFVRTATNPDTLDAYTIRPTETELQ